MQTKTIGIIGGIAPESTVDYYKSIINEFKDSTQSDDYPSIIINSINMTKMINYISDNNFIGLVNYLSIEILKLKNAGADFAILASNTPHIVFEQLKEISPLELISIVETSSNYAKIKRFSRCGLFGTKFTMTGGFYQSIFERNSIEVITPNQEQMEFIHSKYFGELVKGIFKPDTKEILISIAREMKQKHDISALILGGTELPLIIKQIDIPEIALINTTEVHVRKIVEYSTM